MAALTIAKTQHFEFLQGQDVANKRNPTGPPSTHTKNWRPPCDNFIKVNTDAAYSMHRRSGAIHIVCRNEEGRALTMLAARIFAPNPLITEALSLREALRLAQNLQFKQVNFELDNLTLEEACKGNKKVREINGIIQDILHIRNQIQVSGFT